MDNYFSVKYGLFWRCFGAFALLLVLCLKFLRMVCPFEDGKGTSTYPIESVYRDEKALYVNTFDKSSPDTLVWVQAYTVPLVKKQSNYAIVHQGKAHSFAYHREDFKGVPLEYIIYKGEVIPVTVFGYDTK